MPAAIPMSTSHPRTAAFLLLALAALSTAWTATLLAAIPRFSFPAPSCIDTHPYTYDALDVPQTLPLPAPLPHVALVAEESTHYALSPAPEAHAEWLRYMPHGAGVARGGPARRAFIVGMFHELHCTQYLRDEFAAPAPAWPHVQHCLNLLRRAALCGADATLERGDFAERAFAEDRVGAAHVCRDWEGVYGAVARDWVAWWKYGKAHNITVLGKPKESAAP
ncbi:hypothetical protein BC834DRAFT_972119 [Gloeopeniophorella convolvens]|nr:hypothetical protein BC834DRAFT_972119 [Gloeopeniophorella convolvens]